MRRIGVWVDVRNYIKKSGEKTQKVSDSFLLTVKQALEKNLPNNFIKFNPDRMERKFYSTTEEELNNITENKLKSIFDKLYNTYKVTMREISNFAFRSIAFEFEKENPDNTIDILEIEVAYPSF